MMPPGKPRWVLAIGLLAAVLGTLPAEARADAAAGAETATVLGTVTVREGRLPADSRVRATPLQGGPPVLAAVGVDGRFVLEGLRPGPWRFEILLPNNAVFAEAGAPEALLVAGANRVALLVQRGRVEPEPRTFAERSSRQKLQVIVLGVAAAAVACVATDCANGDDSASPSTP